MKEIRHEITPLLNKLFNLSLKLCKLPDDWKLINVSVLYKKGLKSKVNNYRPVALTCILCEVFESIISDHLITYFKQNNLFSNNNMVLFMGDLQKYNYLKY